MRRLITIASVLLAAILLLGISGLLILRTDWFREKLRQRVVAELEKATGGRVEIARIDFDAKRWHGRADGVAIHGLEAPAREPLFQARALEVDLKIVSFLKRQVDVAGMRLEAPEIHVWVNPDGSTNIPSPRKTAAPGRLFTEDLLDLAVGRFELERGALWWNDSRYALELAMSDLRVQVRLEGRERYSGRLEAASAKFSSPPRLPPLGQLAAAFQIERDRIHISELTGRTPHSEWKAHGVVTELVRPRWQLTYEANVDTREIATAVPLPELKSGRVELRGSLDSGGAEWKTGGRLSARDLAVAGKGFRVKGVSAQGEYQMDPKRFRAENLNMRLLDGVWKGRLAADYSSGRATHALMQGRLEGVRLEAAAAALSTSEHALDRLGWTAAISGPLDLKGSWPLSERSLSVETDLTLSPPQDARGLLPVGGALRASYRGRSQEIQLVEARLATAATSLTASGRMSLAANSALDFRLRTTQIEDLTRPVAALSSTKFEMPVRLNGQAQLQGRVTGTLEQPQVDATIDVARFVYANREWDSFGGRVQWSPTRVRVMSGRLAKGRTAVSGNLTAGLENGRLTDNSPLEAEVAVRDTQLQDLVSLAGKSIPISGALTATLKVQGTRKEPAGGGRIEIRRGAIWGEPFDALRAGVVLAAGEVRLTNAQISKSKNAVTGSAAFHPERRTFRFDVRADNVSLADIQLLGKTGRKVAGSGSLEAAGSGRLVASGDAVEQLALEGDVRLRKISLDGRALGDLTATARNEAGKMRVQIKSAFVGAELAGKGEVALRDQFPMQGQLQFRNLDVSAALRAAGVADWAARVAANGSVSVRGDARAPKALVFSGEMARLQVDWPESPSTRTIAGLRNAEPVKFRVAAQRMTVESLHLVGEGSDLRSSGSVDLRPGGPLDLSAQGTLALAALGAWVPNLDVGGSSVLNASITGTRERPDIRGTVSIRNASVGSEDMPVSLSNANGSVTFTRQHATIQELKGELGGGEIRVSGDADLIGGRVLYRLQAEARQVRLRRPRGLSTVLEGVLSFSGGDQGSLVSGDVRIVRAGTRASADLGALLALLRQPARIPSRNDWLQGMQLNVSIVTSPDIRFETPLARNFQADATLRLQGTALNPALMGRVNITQGEFEFQGTRYTINRGDITFANPFRIDPILNLDLETRVSTYDITLTLAGTLQKLNVSYRSDPPLPLNELITLLAVGRAPTTDPTLAAQQTLQARSLAQIGASSVVGQVLTKPATGRLQRFFGVSRLKFDPELSGPEGNPNARVTLEQQVGKDITLTYVYNLASAQEQVIRVQWAISKQLSLIVLVRDQNGVFGVDFLYRKRYR